MKRILYIISVLLFLSISDGYAQQYTASATYGTIYIPAPWFGKIESITEGVDFSVSWPVFHEQGHRLPYRMGIKANYAYLPTGIAGDRFGLSTFARTPICEITPFIPGPSRARAGNLSGEFGTGLGFYTKPKSLTGDEKNHYIATYMNCVIDVGLVYTQPITDRGALVVGGKFIHNSNGFFAKPNMGINYWQVELGWQFDPKRASGAGRTLSFSEKYDARTGGFLAICPGFDVSRSKDAPDRKLFPAYTAQFGWRYAYQPSRSVAVAAELSYNFANNYDYWQNNEPTPLPAFIAISATHESHWGPVSMRLGLGYQIYEPYESLRLFERAGVFYNFYSSSGLHQFVGASIKANSGHADFIEWTYGIDLW